MSLLNKIKTSSASEKSFKDEEDVGYTIPEVMPRNFIVTSEILRRKREDELRAKYCDKKNKTGDMK